VCSPIYATGVGLVLYGGRDIIGEQNFNNGNIFNGITIKMKEWVKGIFKL
jgi:hypothetical protein